MRAISKSLKPLSLVKTNALTERMSHYGEKFLFSPKQNIFFQSLKSFALSIGSCNLLTKFLARVLAGISYGEFSAVESAGSLRARKTKKKADWKSHWQVLVLHRTLPRLAGKFTSIDFHAFLPFSPYGLPKRLNVFCVTYIMQNLKSD